MFTGLTFIHRTDVSFSSVVLLLTIYFVEIWSQLLWFPCALAIYGNYMRTHVPNKYVLEKNRHIVIVCVQTPCQYMTTVAIDQGADVQI